MQLFPYLVLLPMDSLLVTQLHNCGHLTNKHNQKKYNIPGKEATKSVSPKYAVLKWVFNSSFCYTRKMSNYYCQIYLGESLVYDTELIDFVFLLHPFNKTLTRQHSALQDVVYKYEGRTESHEQLFLHANWEQQTKESAVVDGTSCCVILECLVTSIACIT